MADFDWPWQYKFPPFFTVQPNIETRAKQLEAWCSLVLAYQKHIKQSTLHVQEAVSSDLFSNKQLNRKLSLADIRLVLEELRKKGNLEWTDREHATCLLYWRSPVEWGKLIYNWSRVPYPQDYRHAMQTWLTRLNLCIQPKGEYFEGLCEFQISSRSMTNTVCTLYELTEGEETEGEAFHGLEKAVLMRALRSLENDKKAEIINVEGSEGVKFF